MMKALFLCCLALFLTLPACDSGGPGDEYAADFEGDLAEAVIRHLIRRLPDPAPGVPKLYCIVKGPALDPTQISFAGRFDDLKLRFVSGSALMVTEPDNAIVDSESRLSPYVLQIRSIKPAGPNRFEAEVGWSYKKLYEKERCQVEFKDGNYAVIEGSRIGGNYERPTGSR